MANIENLKKIVSERTAEEGQQSKPTNNSIMAQLSRMGGEIKKALPKGMSEDRFMRIVVTELRKNPMLQEANPTSFLAAVMTCGQLGLEPGVLGQAYFVPYHSSVTGQTEVQFQIGYKGLLDLVRRSGQITNISVHEVYEKDQFKYAYGLNEILEHVPADGERGEFKYVYAVALFKDGGHAFEVMSKTDIDKIRSRSKASGSGPWVTDYVAMAKKTVIKALCKYLPLATDVSMALTVDETTKTDLSPIEETVITYEPEQGQ